MKSYISPKVSLRKSKIGKGLFATQKIKKGETVVDFSTGPGKLLSSRKAYQLFKKGYDYMIQVDDYLHFGATNKRELEKADFVNHSCQPNCGIKDKLKIVTMRNIKSGEEITFDYAMSESSRFRMKCQCQRRHCRDYITGHDWKDKKLQKKYGKFFSEYLLKRINK